MRRCETCAVASRRWTWLILFVAALAPGCAARQLPLAPGSGPPPVAAPPGSGSLVPPEAVRADLAQLYATLKRAHFNLYARVTREAYDQHYSATLASIERPATRDEVATVLGRFVAFGRVAHARIDATYDAFDRFRAAGGRPSRSRSASAAPGSSWPAT